MSGIGRPRNRERERTALLFIREFFADRGFPPTMREIAAACGASNVGRAHEIVDRLEQEGFITRVKGSPRTIRVTKKRGAA